MEITNNGYTAKVLNFGLGEYALAVSDLVKLDGHIFTEFYRKLKKKFVLDKYKRHAHGCTQKNTALTLDGCIAICEMFREPNDELIKKIKNAKVLLEPKCVNEVAAKKPDIEKLVDIELERKRKNQIKEDILKADNIAKLDMILQRVKSIEVTAGQINSHFQDCVDKIDNRLLGVENNLSYLNDKPNQQDTSFRTLLKECIKEIIKEELQQ